MKEVIQMIILKGIGSFNRTIDRSRQAEMLESRYLDESDFASGVFESSEGCIVFQDRVHLLSIFACTGSSQRTTKPSPLHPM